MNKILLTRGLGVDGKQNELIELALTHKFTGVEVDMVDLLGRHDTLGKQFACQFLQSADISLGTFKFPIDFGGTDEAYEAELAKLDTIIDLATTLKSTSCAVSVRPNNADFSFQECFEKFQSRLEAIAEKIKDTDLRLGLYLNASTSAPVDGEFKFIHKAEELITLVNAIGNPKVGICLDMWEWVVGGGTVAMLKEAGLDKITEVRLADVEAGADLENINPSQRTALPGDTLQSATVELMKELNAAELNIPISVSTVPSSFSGSRDTCVSNLSKQLDMLLAGDDPAQIAADAAAAAAAEEAEAAAAAAAE